MTEEIQQLLERAQVYQQQIQGLITQKEAMKMQLLEIEKALEELGKSKDNDVYKLSGPVLIKSDKAEVKKDLAEKKESMELRVKTLEKSEGRIKDKIEELRKKLTAASNPSVKAGG